MRSGGTSRKGGVEVELKTRIQFQHMAVDLNYVNLVVTFEMDLTEVVLVQEVIGSDQPLVVVSQADVVGPGADAQIDDRRLDWMLRVAYIQHPHLSGLEGREEQLVSTL